MSNKRSLHMFQQGSPKRRKSSAPQMPDTVPNHHKYPTRESDTYPHTNQQQSTYQPSYQNHNFQPTQNQNRNFYDVPGGTNCNDQQGPRVFQQPPNNLGYNPAQNMPAPNNPAQNMPAPNNPAQNMPAHNNPAQNMPAPNNTAGPRLAPPYSGQGGNEGTASKMYTYQEESCYLGSAKLTDQAGSYNRSNSYQYQHPASKPRVTNNPQNSFSSSFEEKSVLYKLNHVNPGPAQQSYEAPAGRGAEQYLSPQVRYYNPQPTPQYQVPDNLQQPRSTLLQQNQHHPHQNQHHPHQNQYPQQAMPSANSWGYTGSPPASNHRLPPTVPGNQPQNRFEYNRNTQPQTVPTTQYKIDSACHQRQASKNKLDELKSESKTGEKRKSAVSDGGKLKSGRKRIVTCNISAMLHWAKLKHGTQFMFEMFACLNSAERRSGVSYKLQLRDSENNQLEAHYYLSSTTQPDLVTGKYYRVVGKMTNGSFHCFKLKEVPYMETRNAMGLIKQSEIAMSKLILQINEN